MIRLDLSAIPDGSSHFDVREDASAAGILVEGGRPGSPVVASLDVSRNRDEIVVRGEARATTLLECARCLEECRLDLVAPIEIVCMVGAEGDREPQENVIVLPREARHLDLTETVRNELLVRVPLKVLCNEACKGLCPMCGTNLNVAACSCVAERHDPRWDALNNFNGSR